MITVKWNGSQEILEEAVTIMEWLDKKGYRLNRIAVERNGAIVPKQDYSRILLEQGDVLEVVSFVGGG